MKYTKGKKADKYESWLVDLIKQDFNCSLKKQKIIVKYFMQLKKVEKI